MHEFGKIPPQAIDLEKIVLGFNIIGAYRNAKSCHVGYQWTPFTKQHTGLFTTLCTTLFNASEPIDNMTVIQQLKKQGKLEEAGGLMYLIDPNKRGI